MPTTHQSFPDEEGVAIVSWEGDWCCRCGSVNELWADCFCGQGSPCREYVRGHCRMARCRYPHPAFHIPGIRSRPGDPIARPPAGTSPREGALPRSASAKFAPKVVAILRTSSGGGTPKRRPCAPNKGSRPCIVSWAGHWQCTCGSTQKLWANCSCGQPAPCREWARGSCQLGDRCKHPHPDFNVPAGLPRSTSAIVRPLPAMEMQSPFSETPVSPMGQFPPVTTWSSLEGLSGVDHTLARTSGRRKASGEMSLARSNVEQAPGEENIVAPSSLGGTSLASESDERPMNASEATTPLAPSPRGWPLFETNPGWSTTKVSEDNDKTWHHQLEQGKISTAASSPKDWRGRLVSLAGKDAWSGGAHVEGSTRSFSSSSVDWMMLSPLGSTPPRPELSWSDPPGSGRPLEAELVLDSVLPPQRLTLTSSHVVSGQPKCLSTHFQSSRGVKGVNEKVGNGLATTSEDASQPTALHQVGVTLLEAGLLDPAFFFALSTCKFLPLWPALGVLTAFEKQQRCERWNSAIDVYIGAGLDLRPGPIIETAAKLGVEGGPMNPHLGALLPSQKALQLGLEAFVARGLEGKALQEAIVKLLSVGNQLII